MSESNPSKLSAHINELRKRVFYVLITLTVVFAVLFPFSGSLYHYLAQPLLEHLPKGQQLIATGLASTFFTPIKLVMLVALFISMPCLLYQVWMFIAPGLYKNERRLLWPLMAFSIALHTERPTQRHKRHTQ